MDVDTATRFARIGLANIAREYPNQPGHLLTGPADLRAPRALHPVFYGSYDWHSAVHQHWMLVRLLRCVPALPSAADVRKALDERFGDRAVATEAAYVDEPQRRAFERPYGWAWLLALHAEAQRHEGEWAANLEPLARAFADRFKVYLPKLTYPIRVGTHFNTAFAMILALEWADANDGALADLIRRRAPDYFGADRDCQAWEPGGDDFLSPALTEALCMRRVLDAVRYRDWFAAFLPAIAEGRPHSLFRPAFVSDRSDGKIAHLDGTNLSRAWCWARRRPTPHRTNSPQSRGCWRGT
jgi:hypothetical protein